jgi:anti-anti-sigma factor
VTASAHVRVAEREGVTVATLTGEIDISNSAEIAAALVSLPNAALGLVIDLTDVQYLDSTGISLLHDLGLRLQRRAQQLIVVSPIESPPRRILELTGLPQRSPVFDELEDAVAAVGGSRVRP